MLHNLILTYLPLVTAVNSALGVTTAILASATVSESEGDGSLSIARTVLYAIFFTLLITFLEFTIFNVADLLWYGTI